MISTQDVGDFITNKVAEYRALLPDVEVPEKPVEMPEPEDEGKFERMCFRCLIDLGRDCALFSQLEGDGQKCGKCGKLVKALYARAIAEMVKVDEPGGPNLLGEDARTLAVTWDSQGARWKTFRDAIAEMVEDMFPDWPVEDPRTLMWLLKFIARQGHTPITWVEAYLARKNFSQGDRAAHELRHIAELFEYAVCQDQLICSSLVMMELLARRWQLIVSAHERDAQRPNYEGGELFSGLGGEHGGVAPMLMKNISHRLKDRSEIDRQRDAAQSSRAPKGPKGGQPKGGDQAAAGK